MATIITNYRCGECGELHEDQESAVECCAPDISEVYRCSVCQQVFDDEDEADEHCFEHNDDEADVPTHAALEAAGQQRLPI